MASINKVILIGNLGNDPEVRYMPNGDAATSLNIATTEKYTDKQTGESKEITEWHRVAIFGKLAEIAGKYLKKGSSVYIEGSLKNRKYTDKSGVEKIATEVRASTMQMLGGRSGGDNDLAAQHNKAQQRYPQQNRTQMQTKHGRAQTGNDFSYAEGDIPF